MNTERSFSVPIKPLPSNQADGQCAITARSHAGKLYLAYPKRTSQKPTLSSSDDGKTFVHETLDHVPTGTPLAVELGLFQGKSIVTYAAGGAVAELTYRDSTSAWSTPTRIFPMETRGTFRTLNLAEYKSKLYLASVMRESGSGAPYISESTDGVNWPDQPTTRLFGEWRTKKDLGLAVFDDHLYVSFIGDYAAEVYVARTKDPSHWPDKPTRILGTWNASQSLTLAVSPTGERLYCGFVGGSGDIHIASTADGVKWSNPIRVVETFNTNFGVGLAPFGGKLRLCFRDKNDNDEVLLASDII